MSQKTYFVSGFRYLIKAAFSLKVKARFYFFINYFYQVRDHTFMTLKEGGGWY